ncbi:MAG: HypC/HybG/HupF family hydrogenase formation chaperone [Proteobacteria bacterium]|nr:HypC/HybG/HupF family hydrogenase formation chaperone [Pseudomonadota bacterium]
MCLAIPMKVLNVVDDFCTVEINGVKKSCFIGFLERKPEEGEYLLVHAGMAIKILDYQSAQEIIDELALLIDGELRDSE